MTHDLNWYMYVAEKVSDELWKEHNLHLNDEELTIIRDAIYRAANDCAVRLQVKS